MVLKKKDLKTIKLRQIVETFFEKDKVFFFLSPLDLSNKNFKSLKIALTKNNIKFFLIKKTLLKKILIPFKGSENVSFIFSGPILIAVLPKLEYDQFSFILDKKNKITLLGFLLNKVIYGTEFQKQLSNLGSLKTYTSLISVLMQKQLMLNFLLTSHIKKS